MNNWKEYSMATASKPGFKVAVILVLLITTFISMPRPAHALCVTPTEEGNWHNIDSATSGVTRINLRFVCQDQIVNGEPYPPGPPWYVRVYGKCHPSDCDWGEVGAQKLNSGPGAGYIYAFYNPGFARKYVYARTWPQYPGYLYVWIWTRFTDGSGRNDYAWSGWFVR